MGFNTGDIVYQLIIFILLFGVILAVYFFVRSLLTRSNKSNSIEQKLDRVIELLEKDRRDYFHLSFSFFFCSYIVYVTQ
ncbi:DUF4083 domain-containing protein [Peribacillus sp. NPDC056705]|uniref:DUF4083 domain-containing protein n=2 Tax=Bacillaceae TaxID=186817 RepID=UPI003747C680